MRYLPAYFLSFMLSASLTHANEHCIEAPYVTSATTEQAALVDLYHGIQPVLERFPFLGEAIEAQSPRLCMFSQTNNAFAYLDVEENQIVIDSSLSPELQAGVLLHELRHLWQFFRGVCPTDDLAMKEYANATLALEADASAISLMMAWDMKESGNSAIWNALSTWESQSDIAASYEKSIREFGDPGLAVSSAFYQWYASEERRDLYYAEACSGYLDRQDATHAIPRYQVMDIDFFSNLCRLPDGSAYQCANPDNAEQ